MERGRGLVRGSVRARWEVVGSWPWRFWLWRGASGGARMRPGLAQPLKSPLWTSMKENAETTQTYRGDLQCSSGRLRAVCAMASGPAAHGGPGDDLDEPSAPQSFASTETLGPLGPWSRLGSASPYEEMTKASFPCDQIAQNTAMAAFAKARLSPGNG